MTHSRPEADCVAMRLAAFIFAWFVGAVAMAAAGEPNSAPSAPPFPNTKAAPTAPAFPGATPAAATAPLVPPEVRSYAPAAPLAMKMRPEAPRLFHGRVCFNQTETRDKIAQRRLADPVRAMRAGRAEGEALRTRLCRWKGDDLLYEVYVLRRDGRVVRLYMNAQNGDALSAADATEHK